MTLKSEARMHCSALSALAHRWLAIDAILPADTPLGAASPDVVPPPLPPIPSHWLSFAAERDATSRRAPALAVVMARLAMAVGPSLNPPPIHSCATPSLVKGRPLGPNSGATASHDLPPCELRGGQGTGGDRKGTRCTREQEERQEDGNLVQDILVDSRRVGKDEHSNSQGGGEGSPSS